MTRFSTRRKIGLIGGTLLAGGLFAATAVAQTAPGTGPGPGPGVGPRTDGSAAPQAMICHGGGPIGWSGSEDAAAAALEAHKAWLDQHVQAGTLTQAQADAMQNMMQARIETGVGPRLDMMGRHGMGVGPGSGHGMGFGRGFGPRWAPPQPAE